MNRNSGGDAKFACCKCTEKLPLCQFDSRLNLLPAAAGSNMKQGMCKQTNAGFRSTFAKDNLTTDRMGVKSTFSQNNCCTFCVEEPIYDGGCHQTKIAGHLCRILSLHKYLH